MRNLRTQVVSVLTIPFLYAGTAQTEVVPAKRHAFRAYVAPKFEWELYTKGHSYIQSDRDNVYDQIETLHAITSSLLEKGSNVDPEIVAAVNEEFWNLL